MNDLWEACEVVIEYGCEECPMRANCLRDEHWNAPEEQVDEMLSFARTLVENRGTKSFEELKWEAEADYWNLRRCDPEDY